MTAPAEPIPAFPARGRAGWALVAASFLIGFVNFPLQVVGWNLDHLPGDVIDNRFNLSVLEHGYRYLSGTVEHFWDVGMFYPARGVTAWSDAHLGTLPLYAALRAGGLSPERAFQGWFLLPFVLNFAAAVWGARRLGLGPAGCAVAAYVFTYGLPLAGQLGHAQLFARFLVPPALALAWAWLRAPRESWRLAATAGCVVYQTYISVYIGYFLVLVLATGGALAVVVSRGRLPWRELVRPGADVWLTRGAAVVAAGAALFPLIDAHRSNGSEVPKEHVLLFAPRPLAWITPPGMAAACPELAQYTRLGSTMEGAQEEQLLPGLLSLGAVALGLPVALVVLVRRGPNAGGPAAAAAVCAGTALVLALLVTKFGDEHDPTWCYEPLLRLPGVAGVRATSRVVLVLLFPAGFVLGALVEAVADAAARRSVWLGSMIAVLAVCAVAADQRLTSAAGPRANDWWWARNSLPLVVERRERVAATIRRHPHPQLVYLFPSAGDALGPGGWQGVQLDAARGAQDVGLPTVNGHSAHAPKDWNYFPDWTPPSTYRELLAWLTVHNHVPPEVLDGLVVIGEPLRDADPRYEAAMRAKYPPLPVADRARDDHRGD
jgi:hypothetical protein